MEPVVVIIGGVCGNGRTSRQIINELIQGVPLAPMPADFGQIELRVLHAMHKEGVDDMMTDVDINTHLAKVTGMERQDIKDIRFSEVYGMQRDAVVEDLGDHNVQVMTMRFLLKYPKVAGYARLRKSRARMMVEAISGGTVVKGNISVRMNTEQACWYVFSYRDTDIMIWDIEAPCGGFTDINAGEFEHTPSNRNQRKMAREAVEEFRQVVLGL